MKKQTNKLFDDNFRVYDTLELPTRFISRETLNHIRANPILWGSITLLSVSFTLGIRFTLLPVLGFDAPLLLFIIPVLSSSLLAGFKGGLLATVTSIVAGDYWFIEPNNSLAISKISDWGRSIIFLIEGIIISSIGEWIHLSRKRMHRNTAALIESEQQFRELANSMPQLVWFAQPTGEVEYYNERVREYEGFSASKKGWKWQAVLHDDDQTATVAAWKHAIETGEVYEVTHRVKMKDGSFRWHLSRGMPVKNKQGKIVKWYGTATDIDERMKLTEQKDAFIGVASHELKTPVTSIKVYTQVLQQQFKRKGDPESAALLSKMESQINKLTILISDLLDVTKIETGKIQFRHDSFDFNTLVKEMIEEVQRTTDHHSIVTKLSPSKVIYGDRDRIGQVITNLLTNAIKYSPKADQVMVTTSYKNKMLTLSVKDFGIGIPKNKQGNLFQRFYRVEGENEVTFPGLGLGLYISSEIITRHHGKIWVKSQEGKGSTFSFSLPVSKT